MKPVVLIKLGGSIITNKEVPKEVRGAVLRRLVREIAAADKKSDAVFILGHGSGSFAHAPAMRYRTKEGFVSSDSKMGMAITQDSAAQLNRIVVEECINTDLPAVSYMLSNALVTNKGVAESWNAAVLQQYLEKGLFPVTAGDVLVDSTQGCTIWSTEQILSFLAVNLPQIDQEYSVQKILHITEVDGVLDESGKTVAQISRGNATQVQKLMGATKGFDVTGGMWHKIEESLALADQGITSQIVSGLEPGVVQAALLETTTSGTTITT